MTSDYAAFLSYSHHDAAWVEVLQTNLEAALDTSGHEPSQIYRDKTDIAPGHSWVTQLQQGLDRAPIGILVATPESMASPRVEDEWGTLIARWRDWKNGRLQVVRLVDSPLPPFLEPIQALDFTEHDADKYRKKLRELLGGILRTSPREAPALPDDLTIPDPPTRAVPSRLRREIVGWLEARLRTKLVRGAVANALKLDDSQLDGHPSWECAASAILVDYTGGDDPVGALRRLLDSLADALGEDLPDEIAELTPWRDELSRLKAGGGLERVWLDKVARDHGRLERYFQQGEDLDLLAQVYVELDVNLETSRRAAGKLEGTEEVQPTPRELRDVLALEPGSASWITGRWVVLGDPGSGKTTMLRHLAASLGREDSPRWVPVYESIPIWLRESVAEALPPSPPEECAPRPALVSPADGWPLLVRVPSAQGTVGVPERERPGARVEAPGVPRPAPRGPERLIVDLRS